MGYDTNSGIDKFAMVRESLSDIRARINRLQRLDNMMEEFNVNDYNRQNVISAANVEIAGRLHDIAYSIG